MKPLTLILVTGFLVLPVGVLAQDDLIVEFDMTYSWEDGGFPDSNVGDVLEIVGVADQMLAPLVANTATHEYTLHFFGLVSLGQTTGGGGDVTATYDPGTLTIYEDNKTTGTLANPGTNPPNATAPSTYTDGTIYLEATLTNLVVNYHPTFQAGSFDGDLEFTGGSNIGDVGPQTDGYTFGGVFTNPLPPDGYDLEWDGQIFLNAIPVRPSTWGEIKTLFE